MADAGLSPEDEAAIRERILAPTKFRADVSEKEVAALLAELDSLREQLDVVTRRDKLHWDKLIAAWVELDDAQGELDSLRGEVERLAGDNARLTGEHERMKAATSNLLRAVHELPDHYAAALYSCTKDDDCDEDAVAWEQMPDDGNWVNQSDRWVQVCEEHRAADSTPKETIR